MTRELKPDLVLALSKHINGPNQKRPPNDFPVSLEGLQEIRWEHHTTLLARNTCRMASKAALEFICEKFPEIAHKIRVPAPDSETPVRFGAAGV